MAWELASARKVKRGTVLRRADVVFENPDVLERDEDGNLVPVQEVKRWTYDGPQSGAGATAAKQAFRTMLIGGGDLQNPEGEIGAWLEQLNATDDTEEPL